MARFNQNCVSRAFEKTCPALHLHLLLEPPPDFVKVLSWIFNLSPVQTLWCWLSNVEKQTWHSHNRRSDSSREVSPKECGIFAWKKHIQHSTSNRCFQLWFVAKFFPENKNHKFEKKNGIEMKTLLRSLDQLDWRTLFVGKSTYAWLST